jgi:hypothetical protein
MVTTMYNLIKEAADTDNQKWHIGDITLGYEYPPPPLPRVTRKQSRIESNLEAKHCQWMYQSEPESLTKHLDCVDACNCCDSQTEGRDGE